MSCVVLPDRGEQALTREFLRRGVPVVSPGWSADRFVAEFSRQARGVKKLWATADVPGHVASGAAAERDGDAGTHAAEPQLDRVSILSTV